MRAKMFRATQICGILGCLLMLMAAGSAHALFIDSFDTSQSLYDPPGSGQSNSGYVDTGGSDILGGQRDAQVKKLSGTTQVKLIVDAGGDSLLGYSQNSGVTGTSLLQWDGKDDDPVNLNPTGLGGVNFTQGGHDSILLRVVSDDWPVDLTFTAYTNANSWSKVTISLGGLISNQNIVIPYSSFVQGGAGPANFTNIGAFTLFINGYNQDTDLRVDFIETTTPIPEPSTLILLGLGGLGMFGYIWTRRKKPVV